MLPDDVYMVTEVIFSSPPRPFVPPMSLPGVLLPPEPSAAPPVSPGVLATPDVPPPVDQVHLAPTFTPKDRSRPRLEDSPGLAPLGPPTSNQGADSGGTGPGHLVRPSRRRGCLALLFSRRPPRLPLRLLRFQLRWLSPLRQLRSSWRPRRPLRPARGFDKNDPASPRSGLGPPPGVPGLWGLGRG